MKLPFKISMLTLTMAAALSFTSCKNKTDDSQGSGEDMENIQDTTPPEGMSAVPAGDTIVRKNDTIVKTGTKNDTKDNPVGEQVP